MRTRTFLAVIGTAAMLIAACTDGSDDVAIDVPEDPALDAAADEDALDEDGTDGAPSAADVTDLPPTTIETRTLDGRTLTITAPGNVIESEPTSTGLRFVGDTVGLRIFTTDARFEDWPGDDAEIEVVEDRWEGEIRIASVADGFAAGLYDDGDTRLLLTADEGPSLAPVTSTEGFSDALDRIDIERTEAGPIVTANDPDLVRGLSLTYELAGIDSVLEIVDSNELFQRLTIEPVEDPTDGAGGEVVVGDDGVIELVTDDLWARIRLVLPDDVERQRGLDLMTLLELELDG